MKFRKEHLQIKKYSFLVILTFISISSNAQDNNFRSGMQLPGSCYGSVVWGHFDNDSILDCAVSGVSSMGYHISPYVEGDVITYIYNGKSKTSNWISMDSPYFERFYNTGTGEELNWDLKYVDDSYHPGVQGGSISLCDFNNDNKLDILVHGERIFRRPQENYSNMCRSGNALDYPSEEYYSKTDLYTQFTFIGANNLGVPFSYGYHKVSKDYIIRYPDIDNYDCYSSWSRRNLPETYDGSIVPIDFPLIMKPGTTANWGDHDNDGDLDLLVGNEIYRKNENLTLTKKIESGISSSKRGAAAWGDYDNDGYLDIFSGAELIRNNGDGTFTAQPNPTIPSLTDGSSAWGDYDNDGFLDIVVTGLDINSTPVSKIYRNNGTGNFSEQTAIILTGVFHSAVEWGDYDNDGNLDLTISGATNGSDSSPNQPRTIIYRNLGNGNFQFKYDLPGGIYSALAWGDCDNDGDLDIIITGTPDGNSTHGMSGIFYNETQKKNNPPEAPIGLSCSINGNNVTLNWNHVTTDETPYKGLTYNLRVGTSPGLSDVLNPLSRPSGERLIVAIGNSGHVNSHPLKYLKKGTYYWSVQAVDNGFMGGAFATEQSFTIVDELQAHNISAKTITDRKVSLDWERGNLNKCIVFAKYAVTSTSFIPENNISYTGSEIFGMGSKSGNGWHCVYNGTNDTLELKGLEPNTTYDIRIFEYEGDLGNERYLSTTSDDNSVSFTTLNEKHTVLSGKPLLWIDYNNDNYVDLLLSSGNFNQNNGDNTFIEKSGIQLNGFLIGAATSADCDGDGDIDILLIEKNSGNVKILINYGDGNFNEQTSFNIEKGSYSFVQWGDYDNDGNMDILVKGIVDTIPVTKIYRNIGNEYIGLNWSLPILKNGTLKFVDINNDGLIDIIDTGEGALGVLLVNIYLNNQSGNYSTAYSLDAKSKGFKNIQNTVCEDFDKDGDIDILLIGDEDIPYDRMNWFWLKNQNNNNQIRFSEIERALLDSQYDMFGVYSYFQTKYKNIFVALDNNGKIRVYYAGIDANYLFRYTTFYYSSNYFYRENITAKSKQYYFPEPVPTQYLEQTIAFDAITAKTYGDTNFVLTANASSNLTINYSSSDEDIAEVENGTVHIVGAGICSILANQSGNENYYPASMVSQMLTVNTKPIEVTANVNQKVYGEADPSLTYQVTPNLVSGDNLTGALARVSGDNVGTYAIQQGTLSAGNNYSITYKEADFNITKKNLNVKAENKSRNYGETNPELTLSIDGFVYNDDKAVIDNLPTINCSATQNSISGAYPIELSGGLDNNYDLTLENGTLQVNTILGTVSTSSIQNITNSTVDVYGELTNNGGEESIIRGFVYSISANPTILNSKLEVGTGIGTFNQTINNLTQNTKYYIRSYAINSTGTVYGNELSFTTLSTDIPVQEVSGVTIYPNPTSGIVYFKDIDPRAKIEIYNLSGSLVQRVELVNNQISIKNLPTGTYIIKIITDDKINTIKVVKE